MTSNIKCPRVWTPLLLLICAIAGYFILAGHNTSTLIPTESTINNTDEPSTFSNWPMFRGSQALDGCVAGELPENLTLLWTYKTLKAIKSSAAIVDDRVFFGSDDGRVYALDLETGKELWFFQTERNVESSPCMLDNSVFAGSSDGFIYSLSADTGVINWKFETGDRILGGVNWTLSPDGIDKWIIVGSYDNLLYCLDSKTGKEVWTYETGNYIHGTPAIFDGKVVFGGCDAIVHVLSAYDGSEVAQIDAGSYIAGSLAIAENKAYVGHYGDRLLCIDLNEARMDWAYEQSEQPYFSSPALTDRMVIIGSRDKRLHCVSKDTGNQLWTFQSKGQIDSSPVVCGEKVIVGSDDGRLYLLRLSDGSLLWSYDIGQPIIASPAVAGGMVVIGAGDGSMYALGQNQSNENHTHHPGTGNFYCGNCIRDNALVKALREQGHDAIMVPMYLPVMLDSQDTSEDTPLFFGGVNVYLQQKMAFFRKSPRCLDKLLDSTSLLRLAAKAAGMTSPTDLGELTVSMLQGEEGKQVKELERLVQWLKNVERPDVVCLSNALLIGVARRIKEELKVPVVCSLQGEDTYLDSLPEPYKTTALDTLAERAKDIDCFIAVSKYYGGVMKERLGLPSDKIHVIYNGIDMEGYQPSSSLPHPPVIGYLARLCPEKGLDTLIESFILLKAMNNNELCKNAKLRIAGTMTKFDKPFIRKLLKRLRECGLEKDVEFLPNLSLEKKQEFLRTLTVFSVPATYGEAFGLYVIEALASGVPVVQPNHAAFPEIVNTTGGGLLCIPDDPKDLADNILHYICNPAEAKDRGYCARQFVMENFTVATMAKEFIRLLEAVGCNR